MLFQYFLFALPLVSAGTGSAQFDRRHIAELTKRHGAPNSDFNVIKNICGVKGTDLTLPLCHKDKDCQRNAKGLSNIPPIGIPAADLLFDLGDGYCHWNKTLHKGSCGVQFEKGDDVRAWCAGLAKLFGDEISALHYVGSCWGKHDKTQFFCDYYCDPAVEPKCKVEKKYQKPCAVMVVGGDKDDYKCPGSKEEERRIKQGNKKTS